MKSSTKGKLFSLCTRTQDRSTVKNHCQPIMLLLWREPLENFLSNVATSERLKEIYIKILVMRRPTSKLQKRSRNMMELVHENSEVLRTTFWGGGQTDSVTISFLCSNRYIIRTIHFKWDYYYLTSHDFLSVPKIRTQLRSLS